jgi:hypothetical protein
MKELRVLVGVAVTILLMALPTVLLAQETDPVQVCYGAEFEAWLAGEGIDPSVWAEDAVRTVIVGDTVTAFSGREEIGANLDELMANGFAYEVTILSVEGNTVTAEGKSWDNDTRALGVAPLIGTEVCVVEDGKIKSLTWTMSEESLGRLGAALAALPQTGGELAPGYAWISALGGLIAVAGLGARCLRRGGRPGH